MKLNFVWLFSLITAITKLIWFLGLPKVIRADRGSENIIIEQIQSSLRREIHNASHSFIYGKSVFNQVIGLCEMKVCDTFVYTISQCIFPSVSIVFYEKCVMSTHE